MVNEKRFLSLMREAYRAGGYSVGTMEFRGREYLAAEADAWSLAFPLADAGRGILAQLVLHTGQLPGAPVHVSKDDGAQTVIAQKFEGQARALLEKDGRGLPAKKTALSLHGAAVWQRQDGACGIFGEQAALLCSGEDGEVPERSAEENTLYLRCGEERAEVIGCGNDGDFAEILRYLAKYPWVSGCGTGEAE